MIVRYVKERGYKGLQKDPHLTLGKDYLVLGIIFCPDSKNYPHKVTIPSDSDGSPGLWEIDLFKVIDPKLPNSWAFFDLGGGYYRLEPEEFFGNFWDRFNDGDAGAEQVFVQTMERLKDEHISRE